MIKIDYSRLRVKPDLKKYRKKLEEIARMPAPTFEAIKPDLVDIIQKTKKYKKYKNVILIGNGGSRTSAQAFYHALADFRNKVNFEFITSNEPEVVEHIKKKYSPKDTMILVISKSGNTVNAIEPLMSFLNYPVLVIVGEKENTLANILRKRKWEFVYHPEVSGRYSAMTTCGLVPASLMGIDLEELYAGAKTGYKKFGAKSPFAKNNALKLALYLYELEKYGYVEIFTGVYSTLLFAFYPLVVQLVHEGTGKNGKGQTIFGDVSPESQHHTIQRLLGGRRNIIGLIMKLEKSQNDFNMKIPRDLENILFYGYPLSKLNGLAASKTMHYDMQGVVRDCIAKKVPVVELMINEVTPRTMGEFTVFWHYFVMYSALLRDQDPFDQPSVEDSKKISLRLRMERK